MTLHRPSAPRKTWVLTFAVALGVLGALGPPAPQAGAARTGVHIYDDNYIPRFISVPVGTTVVWQLRGNHPHSVTADDGSFDSSPRCPPECMKKAELFARDFTKAGDYRYHCRVHGAPGGAGMSGIIHVLARGQTPLPPITPPPSATAAPSRPGSPATTVAPAGSPLAAARPTASALPAVNRPRPSRRPLAVGIGLAAAGLATAAAARALRRRRG